MRALPTVAERRWVSRCKNHYKSVLGAGAKVEDPPTGGDEIPPGRDKKCDKLIDPTVRVMGQAFFICHGTRKQSRYMKLLLSDYSLFVCLVAVVLFASPRGRKILKFNIPIFASSLTKFWLQRWLVGL